MCLDWGRSQKLKKTVYEEEEEACPFQSPSRDARPWCPISKPDPPLLCVVVVPCTVAIVSQACCKASSLCVMWYRLLSAFHKKCKRTSRLKTQDWFIDYTQVQKLIVRHVQYN
eukprot:TRINITY_DN23837_c0_g1_i2.p1 TRINITY_DN23837_c0_g1~~TRINITY_DN23837_c0_g1_i2.p1  ORF type:complete len:113 (+),score=14.89 TRINITY_DN23837_c0_g1_i2:35-373(+)